MCIRDRNRDSPNQFVDERRAVPELNLLSHLHWDHVQGLPFCDATDRNDARVTLFVPDQLDGSDPLEVLSRSMSPPHFPVRADELRGDWSFLSLSASTMEVEEMCIRDRVSRVAEATLKMLGTVAPSSGLVIGIREL